MLLHNNYLAPGLYEEINPSDPSGDAEDRLIVVQHVVTHAYSSSALRQLPLHDPIVVWRPLKVTNEHVGHSILLSEFPKYFQPKQKEL